MISMLEAVGALVVGVAGRFAVFFLAGLLLVIPAILIALAWRAVSARGSAARRAELRFAPGHTWVAPRGRGAVAVGLDAVAERILPSATALELPARGMQVHKGDPIAVVRAGRRAIHVGAPIDGVVVAVNRRVRRDPTLVKQEPYGRGWLFAIAPRDDSWKKLPTGPAGEAWVAAEQRRLARFVEEELGLAAADGGELLAPAPALLGEEGWRRVVASFLHAAA
jgi:glycine cleavage system H lipoate-binding protein